MNLVSAPSRAAVSRAGVAVGEGKKRDDGEVWYGDVGEDGDRGAEVS